MAFFWRRKHHWPTETSAVLNEDLRFCSMTTSHDCCGFKANLQFHHFSMVAEFWWLQRPLQSSELIAVFKEPVWDDWSFVRWCSTLSEDGASPSPFLMLALSRFHRVYMSKWLLFEWCLFVCFFLLKVDSSTVSLLKWINHFINKVPYWTLWGLTMSPKLYCSCGPLWVN